MVRAAPPQTSGGTAANAEDPKVVGTNKFHWNLRSFHENDDSFRGRDEHARNHGVQKTASAIFARDSDHPGIGEDSTIPTTTALVDGNQVCFELRQNVTQPPKIDRQIRLQRSIEALNAETSHWEVRLRFWMIQFSLVQVTVAYLALFMLLNVIFAALFYAHPDRCCDDPDLEFSNVMAFTVQTSTTIGYGGYVPDGFYANFLVVMLSYAMVLLNTVLAGLLFLKFTTPVAKIEFSNAIVYCNVNGLPCLQLRVGNADGFSNRLTDVRARLTHTYIVKYKDENGKEHQLGQNQELKLLNDQHDNLGSFIWTLRHVIDETSPLFGLNLSEYPGNSITEFQVTINAVQDITKSPVVADTTYLTEDVLIGHAFQDQMSWDPDTRTATIDYAKTSFTEPAPVWYPKQLSKPIVA